MLVAWSGVVVCTGFVLVGILLLMSGIREWYIGSASVKWPITQGEITRVQIVKGFTGSRQSGIALAVNEREISVRYTVNGAEYASDFKIPADSPQMPPAIHPSAGFSSKTNLERITLYYDPENPREAVLHPGDQGTAVYGIAFGGMATFIGSMFIFALASWLYKPAAKR